MIRIPSSTGQFAAYLSIPRSARGPGVLILPDTGLDENMRTVCDWYSARGFVALCPGIRESGDAESALAYLRGHPACTGRVGAVAYGAAVQLTSRLELDAIAPQKSYGRDQELENLRALDLFLRTIVMKPYSLEAIWSDHLRHEFGTKDTEATLATMAPDAYVNHIPVLTGGVGLDALREFYSQHFIPQMPPDTKLTPLSRTVGEDQIADEMIFEFTHTIRMDWMLPGVEPTGRHVAVPLVAIVKMKGDKLAHEHIYWDQASVLVQLGLLNPSELPVAGVESARKAMDPTLPARPLGPSGSSKASA